MFEYEREKFKSEDEIYEYFYENTMTQLLDDYEVDFPAGYDAGTRVHFSSDSLDVLYNNLVELPDVIIAFRKYKEEHPEEFI